MARIRFFAAAAVAYCLACMLSLMPREKHKARGQTSSSAAADEWEKHFSEIFHNKSVSERALLTGFFFHFGALSVSNNVVGETVGFWLYQFWWDGDGTLLWCGLYFLMVRKDVERNWELSKRIVPMGQTLKSFPHLLIPEFCSHFFVSLSSRLMASVFSTKPKLSITWVTRFSYVFLSLVLHNLRAAVREN